MTSQPFRRDHDLTRISRWFLKSRGCLELRFPPPGRGDPVLGARSAKVVWDTVVVVGRPGLWEFLVEDNGYIIVQTGD